MKFKTILILCGMVLLGGAISMYSSGRFEATSEEAIASQDSGIKWYGYDEGMALGKKEGKKIVLHFYASWCGYCKKMDKETFSKSDVAAFMNENFISIKLDTDVEKTLAQEYGVTGLPTTCFMDKDGTKLQILPGYLPREMFLAYLKYIQADSYKNMTFKAFMGVQ